jgi:hypothetical protein
MSVSLSDNSFSDLESVRSSGLLRSVGLVKTKKSEDFRVQPGRSVVSRIFRVLITPATFCLDCTLNRRGGEVAACSRRLVNDLFKEM